MVMSLIGSTISFMVNTTLFLTVMAGVAIYTKPNEDSFDKYHRQHIASVTRERINGPQVVNDVVSGILSVGSRVASKVAYDDFILFKTATVTYPTSQTATATAAAAAEGGPIFIGALGQWFCIRK